jgi:hypothetical protein
MAHKQGILDKTSKLAATPLAVAYVAVPLLVVLVNFTNPSPEASPILPWLILAGLGVIGAILHPTQGKTFGKLLLYRVALSLLLIMTLVLYGPGIARTIEPGLPYLMESTPLILLLFCGLWIGTFGMPDRADFQKYGALLGALCAIDLVAEAVVYQAVPTIRWIGNADILAGLLLVSLCASLKPGANDGGVHEPDQGRPLWRLLIMIGILACLSRTGLFAAAWVFGCFGRGRKRVRLAYSMLCLGLIAFTFFLPTTASDSIRYIDYWLWLESARLFAENPMLLFSGFPVPIALPVAFPVGMSPIWEAATGTPTMMGAYLPQIPSFWLRLVLAWGISAPLAFMITLFILLFRHLTRMGAGLVAALFALGMNTPLLFDPSMAVILGLGFVLALSEPPRKPNIKIQSPNAKEDAIPPAPDPVEEWDLRPL